MMKLVDLEKDFQKGYAILKKGKKIFHKLEF